MPAIDVSPGIRKLFLFDKMSKKHPPKNTNMQQSIPYSAKKLLVNMRNLRDPFSFEAERAITSFHNFVSTAPSEDINLEECSVFLSSCANIFSLQIKTASKHMNNFAAFTTNTLKDDPPDEPETDVIGAMENDEQACEPGAQPMEVQSTSNCDTAEVAVENCNERREQKTAEHPEHEGTTNENSGNVSPENADNNKEVPDAPCESGLEVVPTVENVDVAKNGEAPTTVIADGDSVTINTEANEANTANESTPFVSIPIPTKEATKRKPNSSDSGTKRDEKRRKVQEIQLPPNLVSIHEELEGLCDDVDINDNDLEFPPILFPEVDLWNGTFDLKAYPDKPERVPKKPKVSGEEQPDVRPDASDIPSIPPITAADAPISLSETPQVQSVANDPPTEPGSILDSDRNVTLVAAEVERSISTDSNSKVLPDLDAMDQQDIQNCINQLHYLPFTSELTTGELARTFHSTVEHLEKIFQKYSMPIDRQLLKAASVVCANMVSNYSGKPINDTSVSVDSVNSFSETFSQKSDATEGSFQPLVNSSKTILERTKEKSVAESRAIIRKRLEEMQRMIVPKYKQWPLIAENTPEFFHRVKQFEQKMKKILADEEKKETFDVSKYEIEVLAATSKECSEGEAILIDGDETCSRGSRINSGEYSFDSTLQPEGVLSPNPHCSTLSDGDSSRKWVPLRNVFNHMKKFDRNECARHFYAVLALLSSQNLDMNYDRHYSEESAKIVTKKKDPSQDTKYPRGSKIMTSRCPDADVEEIYVTALATKSVNESFRDLISQEMKTHDAEQQRDHGLESPSRKSLDSMTSSVDAGFVSDEFVSTECVSSFSGKLFGGRNNTNNF